LNWEQSAKVFSRCSMKTRTLVDSLRLAGRKARIGTIRSNGVRRRKKSTFSEFCCEEPCCRLCNRFYAERNDSTARCPGEERGQKKLPPLRHAFLFGIARIPHSAKSACSAGTSTYQAIESVSGEIVHGNHRRSHVKVNRKSGPCDRRFAGHWRSDRETSGHGWSERG
jgi:hypothetical protein